MSRHSRTTYDRHDEQHKLVTSFRQLSNESLWLGFGGRAGHWLGDDIAAQIPHVMGPYKTRCHTWVELALMSAPSIRRRLCRNCVDLFLKELRPPKPPHVKRRRRA